MKKRIIILCDGTWNDLEMRYITNVGRLAQILEPEGKRKGRKISQVVYYDDGVAAADSGLAKVVHGAFGGGLERNIYEAYRFLVFNYQKGDEVCLFGFSRGAYTVRSLAGMIERVGLVPKTEMKHVAGAMAAYRGSKSVQDAFRKLAGSSPIDITLLGCWDTVGARGIPDKIPWLSVDELLREKYRFHDTNLGPHVQHALHAVAIHELRKEFDVTLMNPSTNEKQTLKQVWFPGDHGCVGGGSWEKRGLSNRCLHWMLEECKSLGIDLGSKPERLRDYQLTDHTVYFDNVVKFPYSSKWRQLPADPGAYDHTAIRRYRELPSEQQAPLRKHLEKPAGQLEPGAFRKLVDRTTRLEPGQSAHILVQAKSRTASTRIAARNGERYRLTVHRAQVWKDGDLDPCDIQGWNLVPAGADGSKFPWKDGQPMDVKLLGKSLIKFGKNRRLVDTADWFELVAGPDGKAFDRLRFAKDKTSPETFSAIYPVKKDGEIHLAANDMHWGIVDKFDNNKGWVWVTVQREE